MRVPPASLTSYLRGLESTVGGRGTEVVVLRHVGDGNVHGNSRGNTRRPDWTGRVRRILDRTVELVTDPGSTLSGERGDGRIWAPFHGRVFGDTVARACRTVKAMLDPEGVSKPGVIVPLEGQDPRFGLTAHQSTAR